ncbi:MAG: hypothetical protein IJ565_03380 [Bacilli bacterium]|nr:hypothetical protein [Bacilli bacterium]
MKKALEIFQRIFGEDNCTLVSDLVSIHLDEVTVKNEVGNEHTIYDVFIDIDFSNHLDIVPIMMTRTTFTEDEIRKGYIHSHVPQMSINLDWSKFCSGQGPLALLVKQWKSIKEDDKEEYFYEFALNLKNAIQTESIEGTPYLYISSLANNNVITFPNDYLSSYLGTGTKYHTYLSLLEPLIIETIIDKPYLISLTSTINCNETNCAVSNELIFNKRLTEEQVEKFIEQGFLLPAEYHNILYVKTNYANTQNIDKWVERSKHFTVYFKGSKYKLKVIKGINDSQQSYVIDPTYFNTTMLKLNSLIDVLQYGKKRFQINKTTTIKADFNIPITREED